MSLYIRTLLPLLFFLTPMVFAQSVKPAETTLPLKFDTGNPLQVRFILI